MSSGGPIAISKFDPNYLEKRRKSGSCPIIAFIGKRNTGKSTLVSDILYHIQDIPMMVCMTGSLESEAFYKKHIHDLFIYSKFDKDVVSKIIEKQKEKLRYFEKKGYDIDDPIVNKKFSEKHGIGIIFDDLMFSNKRFTNDETIREIFFNGRHLHIVFIITMQSCLGLPPQLRDQIDYVFVLRENKKKTLEKLYNHYFGVFPKFSKFEEAMQSLTGNYGCIVLDNTSNSPDISNCIYYYKAEVGRQYKIGSDMSWKYWNKLYDKNKNYNENKSGTVGENGEKYV